MLAQLFHEIIDAVHPTIAPDDELHGLADEAASLLERLANALDRIDPPLAPGPAAPAEPATPAAPAAPEQAADVPAGA